MLSLSCNYINVLYHTRDTCDNTISLRIVTLCTQPRFDKICFEKLWFFDLNKKATTDKISHFFCKCIDVTKGLMLHRKLIILLKPAYLTFHIFAWNGGYTTSFEKSIPHTSLTQFPKALAKGNPGKHLIKIPSSSPTEDSTQTGSN